MILLYSLSHQLFLGVRGLIPYLKPSLSWLLAWYMLTVQAFSNHIDDRENNGWANKIALLGPLAFYLCTSVIDKVSGKSSERLHVKPHPALAPEEIRSSEKTSVCWRTHSLINHGVEALTSQRMSNFWTLSKEPLSLYTFSGWRRHSGDNLPFYHYFRMVDTTLTSYISRSCTDYFFKTFILMRTIFQIYWIFRWL